MLSRFYDSHGCRCRFYVVYVFQFSVPKQLSLLGFEFVFVCEFDLQKPVTNPHPKVPGRFFLLN